MMTWPYMLGGAVLIVALAFGGGYIKGRSDGRVQQLQDSVKAYEKRGTIDHETNSLSARDLCLKLGGLSDDCDDVRGMDQATQGQ
jgi:hypothetical protein